MIGRAYLVAAAGAVVGLAAVALWVRSKGSLGKAANAAAVGAVENIGEAVGVPRTDADACARALAEGRMWDASFACPAGDFIGGAWRRATTGTAVRDLPAADYDETGRLARRYPAPAAQAAPVAQPASVGGLGWGFPGDGWTLGVSP